MAFTIVKKGSRSSEPKVYISESSKTMAFSAGFFRNYHIKLDKEQYVRLAYDSTAKEIAFEFSKERLNDKEYLKLTLVQSKTSASCSINPIIVTFKMKAGQLAGTYEDEAINGPQKINGFSDNGYILKTKLREK